MSFHTIKLYLLGRFSATVNGEPLPHLRSRKCYWLLALLALRQGREVSRAWLAETLWPDSPESQAYYNLRQSLSNLRSALGDAKEAILSPTPQTLALCTEKAWNDVGEFNRLFATAKPESLSQAIDLYRGDLMEGCDVAYFQMERAALENDYLTALETLASSSLRHNPSASVRYLRLMLVADPLRESTCCALMEALASVGDYSSMTQTYRDMRLRLHRELNASPSQQTQTVYASLIERSKLPYSPLPVPGENLSALQGRLPVPLTKLIGREKEVELVVDYLKYSRLVTLIGSGGVGKTRLAIAVGEALAQEYSGGVWTVELAGLTDPERVTQKVAKTLGLAEKEGHSQLERLCMEISGRSMLILLDNAEHLLDACALLAESLLRSCPFLRILVTSRQRLGLTGEQEFRVPSLALPSGDARTETESIASLQEYAGVRLFVERASQSKQGFHLSPKNADSILQICRRLDGIPLAIELAAARLKSLSLLEIETRLYDRFALLVGGSRNALPRHQTLKALIDWSYDLLSESEKLMLRRLSLFVGDWTLAQAEKICRKSSNGDDKSFDGVHNETSMNRRPSDSEILAELSSLIDQSLVFAVDDIEATRYGMLETVRQYAREKLLDSSEEEETNQRHCDCFLALAEESSASMDKSGQGRWLTLLEKEYGNLRAALHWCRERKSDEDRESRLVSALYSFWHLRGYAREGKDCLMSAAEKAKSRNQQALQANLMLKAGALARLQGEFPEAETILERALSAARESHEEELEAGSLVLLGSIALTERSNAEAVVLLQQALAVANRIDSGEVRSECLVWLGDAARWRGDYASAQDFYDAGLKAALPLNRGWFEAIAVGMMAELALLQDDVTGANLLALQALQGYVEAGDQTYCLLLLDTFAGISLKRGAPCLATQLLAFVDHISQTLQTPLPLPEQLNHQRRLAMAKAATSPDEYARAYESGSRMKWESVISHAREIDPAFSERVEIEAVSRTDSAP